MVNLLAVQANWPNVGTKHDFFMIQKIQSSEILALLSQTVLKDIFRKYTEQGKSWESICQWDEVCWLPNIQASVLFVLISPPISSRHITLSIIRIHCFWGDSLWEIYSFLSMATSSTSYPLGEFCWQKRLSSTCWNYSQGVMAGKLRAWVYWTENYCSVKYFISQMKSRFNMILLMFITFVITL